MWFLCVRNTLEGMNLQMNESLQTNHKDRIKNNIIKSTNIQEIFEQFIKHAVWDSSVAYVVKESLLSQTYADHKNVSSMNK
mgnify:CR=1 FL=1